VAARILVVDDDPDMVTTCAQILARHGYRALTALAGADAIAMMDAEQPDLVVADLHMPGVDGVAVARHARNRRPPIPVVLMTAWPVADGAGQWHPPDAAAYLAKPFAIADFVDAVRRTLDEIDRRRRASQEADARTPCARPDGTPTTRHPNGRPGNESSAGSDRADGPGQP
jgi:DNA-binding NtrC family response regulator